MSEIHQHQLSNGLWLVAEPIAAAQSVALSLLTPAGVATEPNGQQGVATVLSEMVCRGAGDLDARGHSDALDRLGIQRSTRVETNHLRIGAALIGSKLSEALPLILDMARRPRLPEQALEPSRDLAIQTLDALEDEPQQKVFIELRQRHYPHPFGRSPMGRKEDLQNLDLPMVRDFWSDTVVPDGSVLGVAGRFDWSRLKQEVEGALKDWSGQRSEPIESAPAPRGYSHQTAQTAQVHIGIAYDAPAEPDERSIFQRVAAAVLSGGMSARLFTEVREKRGLCYAVYAAYAGQKQRGAMLSYAGTTTARAQETLDVLTAELHRLSEGIIEDEFRRAVVTMKSHLVMQGESTSARAAAIAMDQYMFGRPRSLDELATRVDGVRLDELNKYVRDNPPGEMTVVTIGPEALRLS